MYSKIPQIYIDFLYRHTHFLGKEKKVKLFDLNASQFTSILSKFSDENEKKIKILGMFGLLHINTERMFPNGLE